MELLFIILLIAILAYYLSKKNTSVTNYGTYYHYYNTSVNEKHTSTRTFNGKDVSNDPEFDEIFLLFDKHFKK